MRATIAALLLGAAALAAPVGTAPAGAQALNTAPSKNGCNAGGDSGPATPTSKDSAGGTAPGNTGNTGFTGGGWGSFTGTSQNGVSPGSPNVQPATAKGLDPISAPPKASSTGNC